ncbi:hypothetical protein ACP70R_005057 [Stipagrostis hirtigluma subsp. patula]
MPPLSPAAAFLALEFVAGNRSIPDAVFVGLLASLPPPHPRASRRLRKAVALRALHAALRAEEGHASSALLLLRKAREVLADPDVAACFSQKPPCSLHGAQDEAAAAAAVADLNRLLDHEWADLPPSALELAADRIAGDEERTLETWATASDAKRRKLRQLVGGPTEHEILAKLGRHTSASHLSLVPEVDKAASVPSTSIGNATDCSRGGNEAHPFKENNEAGRAQEDQARHHESVKGAPVVQLQEKSVASGIIKGKVHDTPQAMDKTTSHVIGGSAPDNTERHPVGATKRSMMERNPCANPYEQWDDSGDSDDERPPGKRLLPSFERKPKPSPAFKYGKGNWKDIKIAYPDVFEDRSTVDMKDKFRNMERYQTD